MKPGPKTNRPFHIGVRVTFLERERLAKEAASCGVALATFCRIKLLGRAQLNIEEVKLRLQYILKQIERKGEK